MLTNKLFNIFNSYKYLSDKYNIHIVDNTDYYGCKSNSNVLIISDVQDEPDNSENPTKIKLIESIESIESTNLIDNLLDLDTKYIFFKVDKCSPLLDNIPNAIEGIIFGNGIIIDKSIDNLPFGLKFLIFDKYVNFSQSIDNLPISLEYLGLDCDFNYPINFFPPNLQILILGEDFSHPINYNKLPQKLIGLKTGNNYLHSIINLPKDLMYLSFYMDSNLSRTINLPKNLKYLEINYYHKLNCTNYNDLSYFESLLKIEYPQQLEQMTLKCNLDIPYKQNNITRPLIENIINLEHQIDFLPESLKYLEIHPEYINWKINELPTNIKQIKIYGIRFEYESRRENICEEKILDYQNIVLKKINLSDKIFLVCDNIKYDEHWINDNDTIKVINNFDSYYEINFI